jgi:transcriptional regulator with XRE-family HTH domain
MNNTTKINEVIRKRRKFLNLTQAQLADRAEISLKSLKSLEYGNGNPTLDSVTKVLGVLGLKLGVELK